MSILTPADAPTINGRFSASGDEIIACMAGVAEHAALVDRINVYLLQLITTHHTSRCMSHVMTMVWSGASSSIGFAASTHASANVSTVDAPARFALPVYLCAWQCMSTLTHNTANLLNDSEIHYVA